jgi:hypothetical protein
MLITILHYNERFVKMIVWIGMDDTDNHESRGTGRLARQIVDNLSHEFSVLGVTRHQLLVDPRVPYTSHNSSATIALQAEDGLDLTVLFERVKEQMLADFQAGSDPGLCVASGEIPAEVTDFGFRAQRELVTQQEARRLAVEYNLLLQGLGGTQDGLIGALASVGLAACGEDGRYLLVGKIRELSGFQTVDVLLESGVTAVKTLDGNDVDQGFVLADKLRPARRGGKPVAYVDWSVDHWNPLKLD